MKPHWVWAVVASVESVLVILVALWPLSEGFAWHRLSLSDAVLTVFALALIVVTILMSIAARSTKSDDDGTRLHVQVPLYLMATGLGSFLGIAIAGLTTVNAVFRDRALLSAQVLLTAGAVALYLMLVLYVRHAWILVPAATLIRASGRLLQQPEGIPYVPLWSDGLLVRERQSADVARLNEVRDADDTALDSVRARAYRDAQGNDELEPQKKVLEATLAKKSRDAIRSAALHVAVVTSHEGAVRYILLVKVQNQLLVLVFLLLAAVATFGVLGWALPMLFGAVGALIVRVRMLTPLGNPTKFDGSSRWMALLLTPLVGAVSSVIGLVLIRALQEFEVLSDEIANIVRVPAFDGTVPYFPVATLAVAAAFGWTARLLDALMKKVTTLVDNGDSGSMVADRTSADDNQTGSINRDRNSALSVVARKAESRLHLHDRVALTHRKRSK